MLVFSLLINLNLSNHNGDSWDINRKIERVHARVLLFCDLAQYTYSSIMPKNHLEKCEKENRITHNHTQKPQQTNNNLSHLKIHLPWCQICNDEMIWHMSLPLNVDLQVWNEKNKVVKKYDANAYLFELCECGCFFVSFIKSARDKNMYCMSTIMSQMVAIDQFAAK